MRRIALVGAGLAAAGAGLAFLAANVFFQPERLVRKLEKRLNARASIGRVELSLFSQPARLVIHEFALAPRDAYAEEATPLAQRPALEDAQVTVGSVSLTVSFWHLCVGKLHVHELVGSRVHVEVSKPEEGDTSLEVLFDDPEEAREKREDFSSDDPAAEKQEDDEDDGDDTIDRLKIPATLQRAHLDEVTVVMRMIEKETRITWKEGQVDLTDVEISPRNLEEKNRADLRFQAKVAFDHLEEDLHYGEMVLEGLGVIRPVDPETRKIEPAVQFEVDVLPGTLVEAAPLREAVVEKLGDLEKYGIRMDQSMLDADLKETARLRGRYEEHLFVLSEDAVFDFGAYRFALASKSWYESEENFHEFHSKITAGPAITEAVLESIDGYLSRKLRFLPSDTVRRLIGDHFLEEGSFTLGLTTRGDIGQPRVVFSEDLPEIDVKAVKDSAEELLDSLKSIFD